MTHENLPGGPLTESDYSKLESSWITRDLADRALLRRVTSGEGAVLMGRTPYQNYEGVVFPYVWPGESHVRAFRLRRDRPPIEYDAAGQPKERDKYLSAPGQGNLLYLMPGTPVDRLQDANIPVVIVEGEKKTISLCRLALHGIPEQTVPRFLPVGIPGVWNWRGTTGKTTGPDGDRRDAKGPIPDLNRIVWQGRHVLVVFDRDVYSNDSVASARRALTAELTRRGGKVRWVNLPRPTKDSRD
jgi:hypothetical protein